MQRNQPTKLSLVPRSGPQRQPARFVCLLVDDGSRGRSEIAKNLEQINLEVVVVATASQALQALKEQNIDIVVAEEYLPGTGGSSLLEAVRHLWPNIGRVLIGKDLGPDVIANAVNRARVQRVLHKKMSAHTLQAEIEAALTEALIDRERRDALDHFAAAFERRAAGGGRGG